MGLPMIPNVASPPKGPLRIIVTGDRNWSDYELLCRTLDGLDVVSVDEGGAPGADRQAHKWARSRAIPHHKHPADWAVHGKGAGPLRNRSMYQSVAPDVVVAFKDQFGAKWGGTEDMVSVAQAGGTPVLLVNCGKARWL